jgi:RNA polymerase sigma-70 factor (ECF subfamily)
VATSDIPGPSDEDLVRQAGEGNVRALETLLDRHQSRVLRVLRLVGIPAQDREDVAQEVFIRVFRHLDGFRPGHAFQGWLYRVTVNAAHDHRTRSNRRSRGEAPLEAAAGAPDPDADAARGTRQRDARRALEAALGSLTERERAVFILREVEGLDTREVARALGVSTVTVRRHLGLARRRLRRVLGAEESRKNALTIERPAEDGGSR